MRRGLIACACALALASPAVAGGGLSALELERVEPIVLEQIDEFRAETWRWQRLMGRRPTRYRHDPDAQDPAYHLAVLDLWRIRADRARRLASNPPRKRAWLCIHRHERNPRQGWRTNTGNGYYGGLQMDRAFQRTYGRELLRRKGTANRWTALEQMWVAERAYRSGRGFHPWPNTARACGLL